jgi:hypothetical protein
MPDPARPWAIIMLAAGGFILRAPSSPARPVRNSSLIPGPSHPGRGGGAAAAQLR